MELLNLQSSLQSEIQAKAAISEELSKTRADLIATQKLVSTGRLSSSWKNNIYFYLIEFNRDLNDCRKRCDSAIYELHYKENQLRELQKNMETSKSCK